jgi:hypothetical protein
MTDQQPKALLIADLLPSFPNRMADQAAAELRRLTDEVERLRSGYQGSCYACEPVGLENQRLSAINAQLLEALELAATWMPSDSRRGRVDAAIAAAKETK